MSNTIQGPPRDPSQTAYEDGRRLSLDWTPARRKQKSNGRLALLRQEGSVIATRSREGWFPKTKCLGMRS
jgi:hypothetical protein